MSPSSTPIVYVGIDGTRWVEADERQTTAEQVYPEQWVRACGGIHALVRGQVVTNASDQEAGE